MEIKLGLVMLLGVGLLSGCAGAPNGPATSSITGHKGSSKAVHDDKLAEVKIDPALVVREPNEQKSRIVKFLPNHVADKKGWANDVVTALTSQRLTLNDHNVCSILAVAEQEATYQADPVVPNLSVIAWKEINSRAGKLLIPEFVVRSALSINSPSGKTYAERIDKVRTEREMSEIFEDMIGMLPMGKRLFGNFNPVKTGGPMQVSIAFAQDNAQGYPYPIKDSIRHEVFTRRGGIWFGTKHIFGYPTDYPDTLYRFADFNAGWYASRNAAFQHALSLVSEQTLALDGDLIRYDSNEAGATEHAAYAIGHLIDMDKEEIRQALRQGNSQKFSQSRLYKEVFAMAEKRAGKRLARAILPGITLKSPKITRNLTTAWFAKKVDERELRCVKKMATID